MTRRLTLTMVAVVTGALLVATLGTLVVTRLEARTQARRELGGQAQGLAKRIETLPLGLAAVRAALRLEDGAVVCIGTTCPARQAAIPAGLTEADLNLARLRNGRVVTGTKGSLAYAAAPAVGRADALTAVVLTRRVGAPSGVLGPWFFVLVLLTLLGAAAVAANLGRRLTRPLREAQIATGRIASGDLAARVPENPADGEELAGLARSSELELDAKPSYDAVVHFAAIPAILRSSDAVTYATNILSTYNVLEAATRLGVRKVVFASSETTYGICARSAVWLATAL